MPPKPTDGDTEEDVLATVVEAGPAERASELREGLEDLGPLGEGGTAEVRRVRDLGLNRTMAMKVLRAHLAVVPDLQQRFVAEAQATAQLQHPGVIPVHQLGELPDGRPFFTMPEIRGRTLASAIEDVHLGPIGDIPWSYRRLLEAFHAVCVTVAYAHDRGVLHRDLKPANVMLGAFGEVRVLDWGLAKVAGGEGEEEDDDPWGEVVTSRSLGLKDATLLGTIAGTPAYMSPEQARGETERIDERTDIYALGAILYELLAGRPPYTGNSAQAVLDKVRAGPPTPVEDPQDFGDTFTFELGELELGPSDVPTELAEVCRRAMARAPAERFQTAAELATEVRRWLDGEGERERALELVAQADAHPAQAADCLERAAEKDSAAADALGRLARAVPEEQKLDAWRLEDEAEALRARAAAHAVEREQLLQAALTHVASLPEAHAGLAADYRKAHAAAERARRTGQAAEAEARLRAHAMSLPADHPERLRAQAWLRGDGALTLHTDPPGAEVRLFRTVTYGRRLVERFERRLGVTPLEAVTLPRGSWVCELRAEGREPVRYPVFLERQEHWDGIRPGDTEPTAIWLPPAGGLEPGVRYVPAGRFLCGSERVPTALERRTLWCDGFAVHAFPISNRRYLAFLNDLVGQGRGEEAEAAVPRERGASAGKRGARLYRVKRDGRYALGIDEDGHPWHPDYPVLMVDWFGGMAYARWEAARTGKPWRLPGELEWEKAARGVDGRRYPWGDHFDSTFALTAERHAGAPLPAVVDSNPLDASVYGVRGLAGNSRDWCVDAFRVEGPPTPGGIATAVPAEGDGTRVVRGGDFYGTHSLAVSAARSPGGARARHTGMGFRLARPMQPRRGR